MRYSLLVSNYPPEIGSAAHLFQDLAGALEEHGHETTVITAFPRSYTVHENGESLPPRSLGYERMENGVRVVRYPVPAGPRDSPFARALEHFLLGLTLGFFGSILRNSEALIAYSPPLPLAYFACLGGKIRGTPVMINVQDLYPQTAIDLGFIKGRLARKVFRWMESEVYRLASHLTAHSEENARYIRFKTDRSEKVHVIHNWVDTDTIRPGPRNGAMRAKLGLEGKFVVTYAGIMSYPQDISTILHAASILKDDQEIVFLLVGDGPRKAEAERLVAELNLRNVILLPLQPKQEYVRTLAASDICLVTLKENVRTPVVPSKLQSILAAGRTPVLSVPKTSDSIRIVVENDCGVCVPCEDPEKMAAAIRTLKEDRNTLVAIEKRARKTAEDVFSLHRAVAKLEEIFDRRTMERG